MTYEVILTNEHGELRCVGTVNGREVIALSEHSNRKATVMMSTCLPVLVEDAIVYMDCYREVFETFLGEAGC